MKQQNNSDSSSATKREAIMYAAMELFRENGYSNTRIIDIAEKAGIGKGTVYAYFDSKEDLLIKMINDIVKKDYDQYVSELPENVSLKESLISYIELSEKMIAKYGIYAMTFRTQILFDQSVRSDEIESILKEMGLEQYNRVKNAITKGIAEGKVRNQKPEQATFFAMTAMMGYIISKILELNKEDSSCMEAMILYGFMTKEELADYIIYGICGRSEVNE